MEWLKDRTYVADRFEELLLTTRRGDAVLFMSHINLGEVFYNSAKEWGMLRAERILGRIKRLPILYVSVTDEAVEAAARIKVAYPISYADGFAASLAILLDCRLVTGDRDFRLLEDAGVLRLEWLGA